jgi:hypothetical protein
MNVGNGKKMVQENVKKYKEWTYEMIGKGQSLSTGEFTFI